MKVRRNERLRIIDMGEGRGRLLFYHSSQAPCRMVGRLCHAVRSPSDGVGLRQDGKAAWGVLISADLHISDPCPVR